MSSSSSTKEGNNKKDKHKYESMTIKDLRMLLTLRGHDCSQCLEKSDLIDAARKGDATDYDEEAHKIFKKLNLESAAASEIQQASKRDRFNNLDSIWKHTTGGGTVYVGNLVAASNKRALKERNICAIVNCQGVESENYFEDDELMDYHRFPVSHLAIAASSTQSLMDGGFQQAFDFIDSHIREGRSVLIHCLAGAHRAGTVGVAWLMIQTGMGVTDAIATAKTCRPIINPFGTLLGLLNYLERELQKGKEQQRESEE